MIGSRKPFRIGQRVKSSGQGNAATLFRGKEARRGTVMKVDQFNCPTVLWDGRKTTSEYHPDFIDPVRKH